MAKRTNRPPRAAEDIGQDAQPAQPKEHGTRSHAASRANAPQTTDAEDRARAVNAQSPEEFPELPNIPEPGDVADQTNAYEPIGPEPTEDDIRTRAYHRYLERGGAHGAHFDDWLEAERELKNRK